MENLKQGLSPKEVKTIQMALSIMIEDLDGGLKNPTFPLTPEARKDMKDMLLHCKSAKAKIDLAVGHECIVEPYQEGDEKDFITKQS